MTTIHVDVVSAEESIFSGEAKFVALPGEVGELGIYPRHTPLITRIKPGAVRIERGLGQALRFELHTLGLDPQLRAAALQQLRAALLAVGVQAHEQLGQDRAFVARAVERLIV